MELGKLTDKQQQAAQLVAKGKKTIAEIAELVGVSTRTIDYWKTDATFKAEIHKIRNAWRERVRLDGVADPEIRLHDLNDLRNRLFGVVYARAKDPEMQEVPGGKTGLLARKYKMRGIGLGEAVAEPEYAVDTGLVSAIIAVQRATREELDAGAAKEIADADTKQKVIDWLNEARRRAAEANRNREPLRVQPALEPPRDS